MSSIADKVKKYLPAADDGVHVRGDSTLSLDNVETMQPPEERTVALPHSPEPEPFSAGAVLDQADNGEPIDRKSTRLNSSHWE